MAAMRTTITIAVAEDLLELHSVNVFLAFLNGKIDAKVNVKTLEVFGMEVTYTGEEP